MKRTSVAFTGEMKEEIEKAVIKIIIETKEKITFSTIVQDCLFNHLEETVERILDRRAKRKLDDEYPLFDDFKIKN